MRFEHRAGEKCFVDYAGQTVPIIDRHTRRDPRRADLRRRARLLELHLRGSHLDAGAARLARRARAGAGVLRRRPGAPSCPTT